MYIYVYTYVYIYIYIYSLILHPPHCNTSFRANVCVCVRVRVRVRVCVCVCVCVVQPTRIGPSRRLAPGTRRCARSKQLHQVCVSVCVSVCERVCESVGCVRGGSVDVFLFLCLKAALEELYGHTTPSPPAVSMRKG